MSRVEERHSEELKKASQKEEKKYKKRSKWKWFWMIVLLILLILGLLGFNMYRSAEKTVNKMYHPISAGDVQLRSAKPDLKEGQPISIMILGVDDGALDRGDTGGRTDTMMVMTLNPSTKQTTIMSLERDSYVKIAGQGVYDKLNAAYTYGGIPTTIDTVENLLKIPVDYYMTVNMGGLEAMIDAVGGVDVKSNLAFKYDGYTFKKGDNHLNNGKEALAFVRMRYDDPKGDYGRQYRQRQVLQGILQKMMSPSLVWEYPDVLKAMGNNMKTDIDWDTMLTMAWHYHNAFSNIKNDYLHGDGFMQYGISYQDVTSDLPRVRRILQNQLELQ